MVSANLHTCGAVVLMCSRSHAYLRQMLLCLHISLCVVDGGFSCLLQCERSIRNLNMGTQPTLLPLIIVVVCG
jgi:hypothetical protein